MKQFMSVKELRDKLDQLLRDNPALEPLHVAVRFPEESSRLYFPLVGEQPFFVLVDEDAEQIVVDSSNRPEVRMNTLVVTITSGKALPEVKQAKDNE